MKMQQNIKQQKKMWCSHNQYTRRLHLSNADYIVSEFVVMLTIHFRSKIPLM